MANKNALGFWIVAIIIVLAIAIPKADWSFTAASANPDTEPYYALKFVEYPTSVDPGATMTYTVKIVNTGVTGFLQVDSGIYEKEQIESWGYPVTSLFAFQSPSIAVKDQKRNCVETEQNVQRKIVELASGDDTLATFTVKTPTDPCGEYYLHVGSFRACYADDPINGGYLTARVARTHIKIVGKCEKPSTATPVTTVSKTAGINASSKDYLAEAKNAWNDLGTISKIVVAIIGVIVVLFLVIPKGD